MECPKCHFAIPEGMQFCGRCGTRLERPCPGCGFQNPSEFAFCGKCGRNLSQPSHPAPKDLSFDEKLSKIQRYLPKGLTEKILSQRDKIEGERRQVTVMFCDLEGFTPLVEQIGAEEAYGLWTRSMNCSSTRSMITRAEAIAFPLTRRLFETLITTKNEYFTLLRVRSSA
jgi:hypothetical protein